MQTLKCKNCGAPLNLENQVNKCEYCGIPYILDPSPGVDVTKYDAILTPNEARQIIGLEPIRDDHCPISRLYKYDNSNLTDWLNALYFTFTGKERVNERRRD